MNTPNEYEQAMEDYRQKIKGAKDPKEAAEYKRLFRMARNQNIEFGRKK